MKRFDPAEHVGKKVFVYFNLHKRLFSIRHKGKVIGHASKVRLDDVEFRVSEAGRQRVLKEKRKNVHAGVVGTIALNAQSCGLAVSYNPYRGPNFMSVENKPMHSATAAHLRIERQRPCIYTTW